MALPSPLHIFCILWPARVEMALFGYSVYSPSFRCTLWCRTKVWEFQHHLVTKKEQPITTCQAVTERRMTTAEPALAVCQHAPLRGCTALGWPGLQTSVQWFSVGCKISHQTRIRFCKHDQSPRVPSCCIPTRVRWFDRKHFAICATWWLDGYWWSWSRYLHFPRPASGSLHILFPLPRLLASCPSFHSLWG